MELETKILDAPRGLYLYGTVPPRVESPEDKVREIAEKLAARLTGLDLDAINVYDIHDEGDRNQGPRPFPYLRTLDSRSYGKILKELTGREVISYKCVVLHPREAFDEWLIETWEQYGMRYLTLVGGSTSRAAYPGPSLSQACRIAASHKYKFVFGGVTIAERHTKKGNEDKELIRKSCEGMKFFTSQVIYRADDTIRLLKNYHRKCAEQKVAPVRIVLTFAPCGHPRTSEFMKWLGVNFPPELEAQILSAPSPLDKSIEVCCTNLRRILESMGDRRIPVGINVESVSIYKDEIDASVELFHRLRSILESFH